MRRINLESYNLPTPGTMLRTIEFINTMPPGSLVRVINVDYANGGVNCVFVENGNNVYGFMNHTFKYSTLDLKDLKLQKEMLETSIKRVQEKIDYLIKNNLASSDYKKWEVAKLLDTINSESSTSDKVNIILEIIGYRDES